MTFTQKFFSDLQVLRSCIIKKTLLGVELSQPKRALQRRLQLAQLLVHGNRLHREALRGIGVADALEALHGFFAIAQTRVKVAHGIHHRKVLRVGFENFFVLSDRVWQLALLDELLRSTENLLLVEAKTKRHKSADSSSDSPLVREHSLRNESSCPIKPFHRHHAPCQEMVFRTRVIVRRGTQNRMVTKGYRKGVYDRVT